MKKSIIFLQLHLWSFFLEIVLIVWKRERHFFQNVQRTFNTNKRAQLLLKF